MKPASRPARHRLDRRRTAAEDLLMAADESPLAAATPAAAHPDARARLQFAEPAPARRTRRPRPRAVGRIRHPRRDHARSRRTVPARCRLAPTSSARSPRRSGAMRLPDRASGHPRGPGRRRSIARSSNAVRTGRDRAAGGRRVRCRNGSGRIAASRCARRRRRACTGARSRPRRSRPCSKPCRASPPAGSPKRSTLGTSGRTHRPVSLAERTIDWTTTAPPTCCARSTPPMAPRRARRAGRRHLPAVCRRPRRNTVAGKPRRAAGRRGEALCRATVDGAVWIGHMRREDEHALKLPATLALAAEPAGLERSARRRLRTTTAGSNRRPTASAGSTSVPQRRNGHRHCRRLA